jgi:hypothetical protein
MEILIESVAQYGISGVFLGVLIYYLNKLTDIHREERSEWSKANTEHVDKFAEVISDNTKALTEMRGEIRENKCKVK